LCVSSPKWKWEDIICSKKWIRKNPKIIYSIAFGVIFIASGNISKRAAARINPAPAAIK